MSDNAPPLPPQPTPPAAVRMQPGHSAPSVLDAPQASSWEDTDTLARRIRDAARPVPKPVPTWRRRTLTLLVVRGVFTCLNEMLLLSLSDRENARTHGAFVTIQFCDHTVLETYREQCVKMFVRF